MRRIHLTISGNVQGVGFRHYARAAAQALRVCGTVENRPDGTVHIDAEGDDAAIEQFVSWCHKGPPTAEVQRVELSVAAGVLLQNDFIVREG